jgi:probable rRNA maturation factor
MNSVEVEVDVLNDAAWPVDAAVLRRAAQTTVRLWGPPGACALSVVIAEDAAVAALNTQFRGIDAPTDVLSFPADTPPVRQPDDPVYLGDLVIAFPYASAQAAREGHALMDSLSLLVVHGTLHLLGYDHDCAEARQTMWAAQEAALVTLGLSPQLVPALEFSGR